jgi:hypothetical protein
MAKRKSKAEPKIIIIKRVGKPSKYHRSRLKLNKDGSITIYE